MQPQALLLDFYGTLVADDTPVITSICHSVSTTTAATPAEIGTYWSTLFARLCADTTFTAQYELAHRSLQATLTHYGSPADPTALCSTLTNYWRQPALYPDTHPFLATLDLPVCLVSNADEHDLTAALIHTGLHFDHVVTSEYARAYKPRPEPFLLALDRLGLRADEVIHVGDSRTSDIAGAQAAGIRALWLDRHGRGGLPGLAEVREVLG